MKVPGGLSFSEFKGFESWEAISVSSNEKAVAVILGNPAMIAAFKSGFPVNGKPAPDGARMAKIHWTPAKNQFFPNASVPGTQQNVDLMVKDSKRFADSGGWGYAVFDYNAATDTFTPGTLADRHRKVTMPSAVLRVIRSRSRATTCSLNTVTGNGTGSWPFSRMRE